MVSELMAAAISRQSVLTTAKGSHVQGSNDGMPVSGIGYKENIVATDGKNMPLLNRTDPVITPDDVKEAVHKMQDYMQVIDRDLHFSVDEDSGITVVKVIDPETKEVVRQIPSEDVLRVVRSLEKGGGLLSDVTA